MRTPKVRMGKGVPRRGKVEREINMLVRIMFIMLNRNELYYDFTRYEEMCRDTARYGLKLW
uniref:Uncharacterized protein n=1 Tax=Candidatus Kentrum sp. TUN TaxID=2126343 RepID=A0A450ZIS3_9GAMM|nr:MAG: hypothetical protein BECKTUN1418D_GA0071000_101834 [Candidatus Kentron sp. TUN]